MVTNWRDVFFEEVPARNPRPWKRERKFLWTSWTFGVWSARIGRKEFRGLDLGPLAYVWTRPLSKRCP